MLLSHLVLKPGLGTLSGQKYLELPVDSQSCSYWAAPFS